MNYQNLKELSKKSKNYMKFLNNRSDNDKIYIKKYDTIAFNTTTGPFLNNKEDIIEYADLGGGKTLQPPRTLADFANNLKEVSDWLDAHANFWTRLSDTYQTMMTQINSLEESPSFLNAMVDLHTTYHGSSPFVQKTTDGNEVVWTIFGEHNPSAALVSKNIYDHIVRMELALEQMERWN